jgi:hypothetical protein
MTHRYILLLFFLLLGMSACVSPFDPNITKYENLLVVDGELSNLKGPYQVRLSRSYKFDDNFAEPVTGALIKIIDSNGSEASLKETDKGVYTTVDSTFQGIVGNSYKVSITLGDEVYESDFETLKKPIPIDRIYWEYQQKEDGTNGIQLLLDSHDSTNSTHYYAWMFDDTWRFRVPIDVAGKPEWKECYKYFSSTNFDIASSTNRVGDIIHRHPLLFCSEKTNRLYLRYTILAKQFSLSEQAYKFFDKLISINHNQGTLFDPIPYTLVGNIKNIRNKDIPVLGYFLVVGASEKRIFIDRSELPKAYDPTDGFDDCNTLMLNISPELTNYRDDKLVDSVMNLGYTVYESYLISISEGTMVRQLNMAKAPCYNCMLNGKSEVPDFWEEKESQ